MDRRSSEHRLFEGVSSTHDAFSGTMFGFW
jgi:hypothetical protein